MESWNGVLEPVISNRWPDMLRETVCPGSTLFASPPNCEGTFPDGISIYETESGLFSEILEISVLPIG